MKKVSTLLLTLIISGTSFAQVTIEYLDINNVKAGFLNRGDFFWNPNTSFSSYEFPKGSGLHSNFRNSIWIAGKDTNDVLHVSAQTYRQSGNDYWSGPLDNNANLDSLTSVQWDKIWKINRTTIDSFKLITAHTFANTDMNILQWPANGNPYALGKNNTQLIINTDMAPFVDVNGDAIYNALNGDYPLIRGEQALWWVFSDNGPTHNQTNGVPFGLEIHAMAYACNQTPIKDVIFLELRLKNKSTMPYHDVRIAINADIDLGAYNDDYIGCDSALGLGICYNKDSIDGIYGANLTQHGTLLKTAPVGNNLNGIGCFSFYDNGASSTISFPNAPAEYANYMNAKWQDGTPIVKSCNGLSSGVPTNFIFADDISLAPLGNSEKACGNTAGDRRFTLSSNNFDIAAGGNLLIEYAFMNTPQSTINSNFTAIKSLAGIVKNFYVGNCTSAPMAINNFSIANQFSIIPQPSNSQITIVSTDVLFSSAFIFSIDGKLLIQKSFTNTLHHNLEISSLSAGNYILALNSEKGIIRKKVVVE
jgi:Secretion system C-terminal sorting domain